MLKEVEAGRVEEDEAKPETDLFGLSVAGTLPLSFQPSWESCTLVLYVT